MYENIIRSVDEFIRYAVNEAFYLKDDYIGTEHILLAFMKVNSRETECLVSAGVNYNSLKSYLINKRGMGSFNNVASKLSKNARKVVDNAMSIATVSYTHLLDLNDPETNIKIGTYYIKYLTQNFSNMDTVYAAYNGGRCV